jgi:hypothetical protein
MDSTGSMGRSNSVWTPDLKMQRCREVITAILAFLLVSSTLLLTYLTFDMVGEGDRMRDAMGVLSLMFGLAGVVVGYYFGRVPGDARAVQAQQAHDSAMATTHTAMEQVGATTHTAMEQVSAANSGVADAMREAGAASYAVRQMAGKAQQIQASLHQNLAEADITMHHLAVDPLSEEELERLRRIVLLLEQEIAELYEMAAR